MTVPTAVGGTVVVVGAINADLVLPVPHLPAPGETVVGARLEYHGGGKGANAAVAAARLGAVVHLVAAVGADDTGHAAVSALEADGVDVSGVAVLGNVGTGTALVLVGADGENQVAVAPGANLALDPGHVRRFLQPLLSGAGCVLVSTEVAPDVVLAAVELTTDAGVPCVLNPAPVLPELVGMLGRGPVLTPNVVECIDLLRLMDGPGRRSASAFDGPDRIAAAADVARRLTARTGAPVVVTLGADGSLVASGSGDVEVVPPRPAAVVDTTGAGDTFNGALATRLAAGDALGAATRLASVAASLSVTVRGARTGMPSAAAVAAVMACDGTVQSGHQ